jgi:hypothetical protein
MPAPIKSRDSGRISREIDALSRLRTAMLVESSTSVGEVKQLVDNVVSDVDRLQTSLLLLLSHKSRAEAETAREDADHPVKEEKTGTTE